MRLLAEEEVVGEIVSCHIFFIGTQEERQPWINGAGTEVDKMVSNEAWDEVRVGPLHEDLGLPLSHKLPRVLPMTLVCSRKPLVMQSDQSDNAEPIENPQSATAVKEQEKLRFKPKVVCVCVCGNFEEVHPEMKDANAAETVPIETLRLIASLLAMNPGWSALSLDICAAFLNAMLPPGELLLMRPPAALIKLALIPEGVYREPFVVSGHPRHNGRS